MCCHKNYTLTCQQLIRVPGVKDCAVANACFASQMLSASARFRVASVNSWT